jgi:hypothetical protein
VRSTSRPIERTDADDAAPLIGRDPVTLRTIDRMGLSRSPYPLTNDGSLVADAAGHPPPGALSGIDWRAALTVECGFHAARRLQRRMTPTASPGRAAMLDRMPPEPVRDPPVVAERRRFPSPSS